MAKETGKKEDGLVEVYVPKRNKNDDKLYVAVNGKRIMVQRGKTLRLPRMFAAAINEYLEQQESADAFIASVATG